MKKAASVGTLTARLIRFGKLEFLLRHINQRSGIGEAPIPPAEVGNRVGKGNTHALDCMRRCSTCQEGGWECLELGNSPITGHHPLGDLWHVRGFPAYFSNQLRYNKRAVFPLFRSSRLSSFPASRPLAASLKIRRVTKSTARDAGK